MANINTTATMKKTSAMLSSKCKKTQENLKKLMADAGCADGEVIELVKAADKLSAYIKCVEELKAGNAEFRRAAEQTRAALDAMHLPELDYFMEHCAESFSMTLDELE